MRLISASGATCVIAACASRKRQRDERMRFSMFGFDIVTWLARRGRKGGISRGCVTDDADRAGDSTLPGNHALALRPVDALVNVLVLVQLVPAGQRCSVKRQFNPTDSTRPRPQRDRASPYHDKNMSESNHRKRDVGLKARALAIEMYRATRNYPSEETYELVQQMRRAAISILSNFAEGQGRWTRPDYRRFVLNARLRLRARGTDRDFGRSRVPAPRESAAIARRCGPRSNASRTASSNTFSRRCNYN
ncbi:MAG: hypothetical protein DMF56_15905 [Acidobacteria bacterium]|nr:MAG: hypothetical protein DMF56_15905 [Acidobacteriota bacterium]